MKTQDFSSVSSASSASSASLHDATVEPDIPTVTSTVCDETVSKTVVKRTKDGKVAADKDTWSHWTEVWRVMPTKVQHEKLQKALKDTRELYNAALEERFTKLSRWHQTGKYRADMQPVFDLVRGTKIYPPNPYFPSAFEGYQAIKEIRDDGHTLADYPVNLLRGVIDRAARAFRSFYSRKSEGKAGGRPRFKSAKRWRTLEFSEVSGVRLLSVDKSGKDSPQNGLNVAVVEENDSFYLSVKQSSRPKGATHRLVFKPIGALRVHAHRGVPEGAVLTGVRLVCKTDGIWEAHLGFKVRKEACDVSTIEPTYGVDWNIGFLAVGSDGYALPNPRLGETARKRRRPQERLVARAKKGSKARAKKVKRLAVLREREADARRTHRHTGSKQLVAHVLAQGHLGMAFEDTDVAGLMAKQVSVLKSAHTLSANQTQGAPSSPSSTPTSSSALTSTPISNSTSPPTSTSASNHDVLPWETKAGERALKRSLADAGIGQLIRYTQSKAESAGLRVVKVAAHGTTQACARCGTKSPTKITLRDRIFSCACGWCADRDVNAALNMLRKGRGKADARPSASALWSPPAGHPALETLRHGTLVVGSKGLCPKPLLPECAHKKKTLDKAKNPRANTSRRNAKKMGKKTSLRKDGGVVVPGVGHNQSDSSDRRRNLVELNNSN